MPLCVKTADMLSAAAQRFGTAEQSQIIRLGSSRGKRDILRGGAEQSGRGAACARQLLFRVEAERMERGGVSEAIGHHDRGFFGRLAADIRGGAVI